jgi:hypothetical protein
MTKQRRRLSPSPEVVRELRELILHNHLDIDGATAALGVDKSRLTEAQTLGLQQAFRSVTSLVRGNLLGALLDSNDDHRLLAQELDKRERLQAQWPSPQTEVKIDYSKYSNEALELIQVVLQVLQTGNEQPIHDLINQLVQSRSAQPASPRPRRRLPVHLRSDFVKRAENVFGRDGSGSLPDLEPAKNFNSNSSLDGFNEPIDQDESNEKQSSSSSERTDGRNRFYSTRDTGLGTIIDYEESGEKTETFHPSDQKWLIQ